MKGFARGYVWWPRMDGQTEKRVKECSVCHCNRKTPPVAGRTSLGPTGPFDYGYSLKVAGDSHDHTVYLHCINRTPEEHHWDYLQ